MTEVDYMNSESKENTKEQLGAHEEVGLLLNLLDQFKGSSNSSQLIHGISDKIDTPFLKNIIDDSKGELIALLGQLDEFFEKTKGKIEYDYAQYLLQKSSLRNTVTTNNQEINTAQGNTGEIEASAEGEQENVTGIKIPENIETIELGPKTFMPKDLVKSGDIAYLVKNFLIEIFPTSNPDEVYHFLNNIQEYPQKLASYKVKISLTFKNKIYVIQKSVSGLLIQISRHLYPQKSQHPITKSLLENVINTANTFKHDNQELAQLYDTTYKLSSIVTTESVAERVDNNSQTKDTSTTNEAYDIYKNTDIPQEIFAYQQFYADVKQSLIDLLGEGKEGKSTKLQRSMADLDQEKIMFNRTYTISGITYRIAMSIHSVVRGISQNYQSKPHPDNQTIDYIWKKAEKKDSKDSVVLDGKIGKNNDNRQSQIQIISSKKPIPEPVFQHTQFYVDTQASLIDLLGEGKEGKTTQIQQAKHNKDLRDSDKVKFTGTYEIDGITYQIEKSLWSVLGGISNQYQGKPYPVKDTIEHIRKQTEGIDTKIDEEEKVEAIELKEPTRNGPTRTLGAQEYQDGVWKKAWSIIQNRYYLRLKNFGHDMKDSNNTRMSGAFEKYNENLRDLINYIGTLCVEKKWISWDAYLLCKDDIQSVIDLEPHVKRKESANNKDWSWSVVARIIQKHCTENPPQILLVGDSSSSIKTNGETVINNNEQGSITLNHKDYKFELYQLCNVLRERYQSKCDIKRRIRNNDRIPQEEAQAIHDYGIFLRDTVMPIVANRVEEGIVSQSAYDNINKFVIHFCNMPGAFGKKLTLINKDGATHAQSNNVFRNKLIGECTANMVSGITREKIQQVAKGFSKKKV